MKFLYSISHAIIQSGLTELILISYRIWEISSIPEAIGSSAILMLIIGIYGLLFGILFYGKGGDFTRLIAVSLLSALFTTVTIMVYPQIGFASFAWYILFGVLLLAAFLAHGVLYGAGARMNQGDRTNE